LQLTLHANAYIDVYAETHDVGFLERVAVRGTARKVNQKDRYHKNIAHGPFPDGLGERQNFFSDRVVAKNHISE